jgi:hypothetical protein
MISSGKSRLQNVILSLLVKSLDSSSIIHLTTYQIMLFIYIFIYHARTGLEISP